MKVKQWTKYILGKLIKLISLLVAVSILSFVLVSNSPIDPVQSYIGADMNLVSPEQRGNIAAYWGLHDSVVQQFLNWGKNILSGDLGTSLLYRTPVAEVIQERFLASLALMSLAWVFSGVFGFILGIIAGMRQGTWLDKVIKMYCYVIASTPAFWLGLLLLMVFSVWLGWLPIGLGSPAGILTGEVTFMQRIQHLILPAVTLSVVGVSNIALHTRQKLIDILDKEFIRYARAKGEAGFRLFWRHGFRNTMVPAISIHFASFGELFGGAVLAEQVFSYPGLGQAVVQAGLGGDVPLLLGIVLFTTIFVYIGNLLADLLYRVIDPRIRRGTLS
ncbi:ABC transporter permease [Oceanobacillus piezotolerans]|uniref:ABC transporter permease n=1 Tax=Oceanobacillus piezotolerans TaxID=2448030 RepID=UPI001FEA8954|nr:ABC transporter permease [Oceanobacillus piezotolerans]